MHIESLGGRNKLVDYMLQDENGDRKCQSKIPVKIDCRGNDMSLDRYRPKYDRPNNQQHQDRTTNKLQQQISQYKSQRQQRSTAQQRCDRLRKSRRLAESNHDYRVTSDADERAEYLESKMGLIDLGDQGNLR